MLDAFDSPVIHVQAKQKDVRNKSESELIWLSPPQVTVIVLGNKSDLCERRQVQVEEAQQWARVEKVKLWEVSVAERSSLMEPFTQLTSRLTQPQSKSSFPLPGRKSKGTSSSDMWRPPPPTPPPTFSSIHPSIRPTGVSRYCESLGNLLIWI